MKVVFRSIRKSASVKRLMQIKDVTREDALKIKQTWGKAATPRSEARELIDRILRTHGVEYLGVHKRTHLHVYYCNAGDTYATTVLFMGPRLFVGCWGDLFDPTAKVWERHQTPTRLAMRPD